MKYMKHTWQYLLAKPTTNIFCFFFQQARFLKELEVESIPKGIFLMFRLALLLFLIFYPFELIGRFILLNLSHTPVSNVISILLTTAGYNAIGIMIGMFFCVAGAIWANSWDPFFIMIGMISGVVLSIAGGMAGGMAGGIVYGITLGITSVIFGIILGIIGRDITTGIISFGVMTGIAPAITGVFAGFIAGAIALGIIDGFLYDIFSNLGEDTSGEIDFGIISGVTIGIVSGVTIGIVSGFASSVSFMLGHFRVLLYPFSSISIFKAFVASRRNPDQVFSYLHRSSLYWDERVYLPLPYLKRALLIAAGQNVEDALEEITFIVAKRPQQIGAARAVSLEIVLRDLETRDSLHAIAQASERLTGIFPQETSLIDLQWGTIVTSLKDASQDAARYSSPASRRVRLDALMNMIADLKKISPKTAFRDVSLNKRLEKVVNDWVAIAQQELERLEKVISTTGQIDNPYTAGPALKLHNSPFVGRRDLAQQLEKALNKENRPTFFLNGERRMGKSSTLNQLPNLLGTHYLPIFYDLQSRGISSSIATFLGTIGNAMYQVMVSKGMKVRRLEYERLQQASRRNEATVYAVFDEWLTEVERILEEADRTVLLTFDEFEKLEEAGQAQYLDLGLLLDWFRSVIQNHPRLALLFSGVQTLSEMGSKTGMNWANYFVNVETLRVSFLQPSEARQLITLPVSDYPSEEIFGEGVVEEIIRVTGCHPFLIQAVCTRLVDNLNTEHRDRAEFQDVALVVEQVLESWWDTYFRDLWQRTDKNQRDCLFTLRNFGHGNPLGIQQQSSLDERTVHRTLQSLLKRDLVLQQNGIYRIAAPIFEEWVERNKYN